MPTLSPIYPLDFCAELMSETDVEAPPYPVAPPSRLTSTTGTSFISNTSANTIFANHDVRYVPLSSSAFLSPSPFSSLPHPQLS